jgi:N12 class adenine-specific DNA methylase
VPQLFDEHLDAFADERAELRSLLSDAEYAAARRSTLNAHFTDAALVAVVWDGLHRLGFTGGQVLEPGCGSGHFIGLAPPPARLVGVERDPISAAVATALYPQAHIVAGSFAELDAAEASFDATVGNVPFGKIAVHDPRHNPGGHSIHNHFIIKALHLTRPGGVVAVLTSRYTLDAVNPSARAEMAQLADLIGAVRLPTGAHRRAAGTDAVTDLLLLHRRQPGTAPRVDFGATWEKALPTAVGPAGALVAVNQYFRDHPQDVLGELTLASGAYRGADLAVFGDLDTLPARFAAAVTRITAGAGTRGLAFTPRPAGPQPARPAVGVGIIDPNAAAFAGFLTARPDATFTRRVDGTDQPYSPPAKQAPELRALLRLRDTTMALIRAEQTSIDDTPQIRQLRTTLNTAYDAYLAAHGPVNRGTQRRQLRPGWHVFADWCERHDRTKLPATADTVRDYLDDLRLRGLGRDHLQRHLDGITRGHASAHNRQLAKAITRLSTARGADPAEQQRREAELRRLATTDPDRLLLHTGLADLHLPADALPAAHAVLAAAEESTSPDLDLDELGLRTTVIARPPQGGFRDDPFANVVRALERFDPTTQTARKADIFTRRVVNPPRTRLGADTPEEALSICLDTHSRVDLPEIARLLGLPDPDAARAALGELVYDDPDTHQPVWAREYLAGNVRHKLAQARTAAQDDARFAVNVAALQRVVPPDLGPQDIEIRLGSWIGPSYVQSFLRELLDTTQVRVEHVAGLWHVSGKAQAGSVAAGEIWGGGGLNAYQLTERLLTGSEIRITKTIEVPGPDGQPTQREVLNAEATEEAKDKAREIGDRFADWVWEDTTRAHDLIRAYNDTFNAEIPPDFTGVELSLPGLSRAFTLREHQKTAVARIIYQPATGLIHDVGAGKTLEMIVGIMERRRRGLVNKPVVVVPNDSIAEQFEREWLQAYPAARLLTGTSTDLATTSRGRDGRAEFVARVATGDWDAVIMTKESFQRIPLHPEAQEDFLGRELDDLRAAKEDNRTSMSQTMTKRLELVIAKAEERLTACLAEIDRDVTGVTLRDSGIDFVVVDEAQNYKNGLVTSALPDLGIDGAHRSIDLDMKLAWLADRHSTPRVVLATATPWTGKFSEVYLWQRRLGHQLPPFDVWARTYCTSESFMEMTPGGTLRGKTRMRRVINEPELWQSLRLTSDIKMKADLNLPTPKLRGGQIEILTVPAPVEARVFTLDLARRERNLTGPPTKGADNHLVIAHHGQLAALDVRTVGLSTEQPQKVDLLADDIHTEWAAARDTTYLRDDGTEHPVPGGLILVFCDESTPAKTWNVYNELKHQLTLRGLPEDSIRFIHEATSPQRKADLLAAAREGAISVLIGSTMKMGAGINVQTRAIGGYEITGHWRPDLTTQAQGRVDRQGNQNPQFFWKRVVTSPSMDAKKWEITAQKHGMFAPLYASTPPSRTREVTDDESISLADVMAAATGDPRYREKAELDQEYKALTRQRSAHQRTQQSLKLTITTLTEEIPTLEATAARQDTTAARHISTRGDTFRLTLGQHTHTNRTTAAETLKELLRTELAATPPTRNGRTIPLGTLGGYQLAATLTPLRGQSILLTFPDAAENTTGIALDPHDLPDRHGLITRLENQLDTITQAPARTRDHIAEQRRNLDHARAAVGKPFPHQQRLAEVTRRRAELIAELSDDTDTTADPTTPDGRAAAERAQARLQDHRALQDAAHQHAAHAGAPRTTAAEFAGWYLAIAGPTTADQRPPAEAAYTVWHDLGQPAAHSHGHRVTGPITPSPLEPPTPTPRATPVATARPQQSAAAAPEQPAPRPSTQPTPAEPAISAPTPGSPASSSHPTPAHPQPDHTAGDHQTTSDPQTPGIPAADNPPAEANGVAGNAAAGPASQTQRDAELVIDHTRAGTLVHGTSRNERELHQLLKANSFRFSSRLNAWYLSRQLRHETRTARVARLRNDLDQAGRHYQLRQHDTTATTKPAGPPTATAEPFSSQNGVTAAAQETSRTLRAPTEHHGTHNLDQDSDHPDGALDDAQHAILRDPVHRSGHPTARSAATVEHNALPPESPQQQTELPAQSGTNDPNPTRPAMPAQRTDSTRDDPEAGRQPAADLPLPQTAPATAPNEQRTDTPPVLDTAATPTDPAATADPPLTVRRRGRPYRPVPAAMDDQLSLWDTDPGPAAGNPPAPATTGSRSAPNTAAPATVQPPAHTNPPAQPTPNATTTEEPAEPVVSVTSRNDVINYVLGEHAGHTEIRDLVSIVLSSRARNGVHLAAALRRLSQLNQQVYRRALTATAGQTPRGTPFDTDRAQTALQRLADGDPSLPLNSLGHYVELANPNPRKIDSKPREPVRGIVVEVSPAPLNRLTVTIEQDTPSSTTTHRASQDFRVDGTVALSHVASRNDSEKKHTTHAATQPPTTARTRDNPAGPAGQPGAAIEPPASATDQVTAGQSHSEKPAATPESNDVAQQWSKLVAQAAHHGYAVHTSHTGHSTIETHSTTLFVALAQTAADRVTDLARMVDTIATHANGAESTPAQMAVPYARLANHFNSTASYDGNGDNADAVSATPIYETLLHEMGLHNRPDDFPSPPVPLIAEPGQIMRPKCENKPASYTADHTNTLKEAITSLPPELTTSAQSGNGLGRHTERPRTATNSLPVDPAMWAHTRHR